VVSDYEATKYANSRKKTYRDASGKITVRYNTAGQAEFGTDQKGNNSRQAKSFNVEKIMERQRKQESMRYAGRRETRVQGKALVHRERRMTEKAMKASGGGARPLSAEDKHARDEKAARRMNEEWEETAQDAGWTVVEEDGVEENGEENGEEGDREGGAKEDVGHAQHTLAANVSRNNDWEAAVVEQVREEEAREEEARATRREGGGEERGGVGGGGAAAAAAAAAAAGDKVTEDAEDEATEEAMDEATGEALLNAVALMEDGGEDGGGWGGESPSAKQTKQHARRPQSYSQHDGPVGVSPGRRSKQQKVRQGRAAVRQHAGRRYSTKGGRDIARVNRRQHVMTHGGKEMDAMVRAFSSSARHTLSQQKHASRIGCTRPKSHQGFVLSPQRPVSSSPSSRSARTYRNRANYRNDLHNKRPWSQPPPQPTPYPTPYPTSYPTSYPTPRAQSASPSRAYKAVGGSSNTFSASPSRAYKAVGGSSNTFCGYDHESNQQTGRVSMDGGGDWSDGGEGEERGREEGGEAGREDGGEGGRKDGGEVGDHTHVSVTQKMLFSTRVSDNAQPYVPERVVLDTVTSRVKHKTALSSGRPASALGELRIELPPESEYEASTAVSQRVYTGAKHKVQEVGTPKEMALTPGEFRKWIRQYTDREQATIRSFLASKQARRQFHAGSVCRIKVRRHRTMPSQVGE
jgi:hypothetical protein